MLLNEFLKEHKKVEEQATKIERLEAALEKMNARLDSADLPSQRSYSRWALKPKRRRNERDQIGVFVLP
jgi:hypothetical protein